MSNYQSSFRVIDLKLNIELSLVYCQCIAQHSGLLQHDAQWSVLMNIYAQAAGGAYHGHNSRVSKNVTRRSGSMVPFVLVCFTTTVVNTC